MENKQIDIKNKLDEGLTFKVSRFKEQIKKTRPHKHDEYFELIFLKEGEGFHSIEKEEFNAITEHELIEKECPKLHKVNQFASLLNTTPRNLNAVCMKHSRKNASEMISLHILPEAKRYIIEN